MKAVLISIQPKWCALIAQGQKTVEVRKTKPKLETPFKCYIYCTNSKKQNLRVNSWFGHILHDDDTTNMPPGGYEANGKVIGEFVCDTFLVDKTFGHDSLFNAAACMTDAEVAAYCLNAEMYGWHISNLVIYDKWKALGEFHFPPDRFCEKGLCGGCPYDESPDVNGEYMYGCDWERPLLKPPQSWCYVEEVQDDK